jgi:transitional endoplasmic reticulum ATPase
MDGLENNDGLFVVASTNFLDRLDPGLSKRPSRFDRKYIFPIPNEHERTLYCEFWRYKLQNKPKISFPQKLCPAMAHITDGFSFAFLQECFVATLLTLAREEGVYVSQFAQLRLRKEDSLDQYPLWRVFKEQAESLRKQIENGGKESVGPLQSWYGGSPALQHSERQSNQSIEQVLSPTASVLPDLPGGKERVINPAAFALV